MKRIFFIVYILSIGSVVFAQGVLITDDGTTAPDTSAILEMKSTSLGFLPPRMDLEEINSIASPQAGMLVYNLTKHVMMIYNGTDWVDLAGSAVSTTLEIGDYYQGGIIFYIDGTGIHGLIAGVEDLDASGDFTRPWGCWGTTTGATSNTDGETNTTTILAACGTANIAADLCDDYSADGYTDWFLPARNQLDSMYVHRNDIGGFSSTLYWSSSETSSTSARTVSFSTGNYVSQSKNAGWRVRPIREF